MNDLLRLSWHLLVTLVKLLRPSGTRSVIAESIMLKYQLIVQSRRQHRSPKLTMTDRFLLGVLSLFLHRSRMIKAAIILKPSTLLKFHKALIQRKYHQLFTSKSRKNQVPKALLKR